MMGHCRKFRPSRAGIFIQRTVRSKRRESNDGWPDLLSRNSAAAPSKLCFRAGMFIGHSHIRYPELCFPDAIGLNDFNKSRQQLPRYKPLDMYGNTVHNEGVISKLFLSSAALRSVDQARNRRQGPKDLGGTTEERNTQCF